MGTIDEQIDESKRKIDGLIERGRAMVAAGQDDEACKTLLPQIRDLEVRRRIHKYPNGPRAG